MLKQMATEYRLWLAEVILGWALYVMPSGVPEQGELAVLLGAYFGRVKKRLEDRIEAGQC